MERLLVFADHFASSMSLLGLKDGDNAQGGYGYLDIVDFILQGCCDVEKNLQELFRRVAFNICIGNSDIKNPYGRQKDAVFLRSQNKNHFSNKKLRYFGIFS